MSKKPPIETIREVLRSMASDMARELVPVYKALDWHWHDNKESPSEDDILDTMHELIAGVGVKGTTATTTGGIRCGYEDKDDMWQPFIQFIHERRHFIAK